MAITPVLSPRANRSAVSSRSRPGRAQLRRSPPRPPRLAGRSWGHHGRVRKL